MHHARQPDHRDVMEPRGLDRRLCDSVHGGTSNRKRKPLTPSYKLLGLYGPRPGPGPKKLAPNRHQQVNHHVTGSLPAGSSHEKSDHRDVTEPRGLDRRLCDSVYPDTSKRKQKPLSPSYKLLGLYGPRPGPGPQYLAPNQDQWHARGLTRDGSRGLRHQDPVALSHGESITTSHGTTGSPSRRVTGSQSQRVTEPPTPSHRESRGVCDWVHHREKLTPTPLI
jgi:hypothetical protein